MSEGVRVIGPDRAQLRWDMVDLDSQLPEDHRARLVWAFVESLDLSEFYDRIKARDAVACRPWAEGPRGRQFCRGACPRAGQRPDPGADDCNIYVRSPAAGNGSWPQ